MTNRGEAGIQSNNEEYGLRVRTRSAKTVNFHKLAYSRAFLKRMPYKVEIDNCDRAQWDECAGRFADYSIYQTQAYQESRVETDGQELSRAVVRDESDNVVAMCHVRIRNIRSLGLRIGYVQQGPLMRALDGGIICSAGALTALRKAYLANKVNVLRIVPNANGDEAGRRVTQMVESSGFRFVDSVSPYRTLALSLEDSEEEIRRSLDRNFRRNLKNAEKSGIEIREGRDERFGEILRELYLSAIERKGFKGLDPDEFLKPQLRLSPAEKMSFVVAYYEGEPVTAHMASNLGAGGVALLVASNEKGLACGSSYLVWWKAFVAAKRAGMKTYDLGGVDREENPGGYQFKSQISKQESLGIGAFDACDSLPVRILWRASEKAYNLLKR